MYSCLKIRKMMPPCKGTTFFEICNTELSGYLRFIDDRSVSVPQVAFKSVPCYNYNRYRSIN